MKTAARSHACTAPIEALDVAAAVLGPGDPEVAAASLISSVEREIYRREGILVLQSNEHDADEPAALFGRPTGNRFQAGVQAGRRLLPDPAQPDGTY